MALNKLQKQDRSEYLERNLEITECSQRKPYVFISYASDDWETVFKTAVVPMQKQYGLRVYADKAFDKVNDRWIVPMLRNVRGADAMIVFVSQSYIESYACFLELLTAVNNKKPIVFVSLEQQLDLGDTTDQPDVERGVKAEIFNQGQNIATNVNNNSNDLMRAMKSAYTSIATLLEQDALSKYDISDAFINFFRDAAINRKSIDDLNAVRRTIKSISRDVFDKSLIASPAPAPVPQPVQAAPAVVPAAQPEAAPAPVQMPAENAAQAEPVSQPVQDTVQPAPKTSAPAQPAAGAAAKKLPDKKILIGAAAAVAALVLVLVLILGGTKNVTDKQYTTPDGFSGVYTGEWKGSGPSGRGIMTLDSGDVFEGEWADGVLNGQGTGTYINGNIYVGGFKDNLKSGTGTFTWKDPFQVYDGEWQDNKPNGTGTMKYSNGDEYTGEWADGERNGQGTMKYENGNEYTGGWKDGMKDGTGTFQWVNGDTYEGDWKNDKRDGTGISHWINGDVYEGGWANDKKDGTGIYRWGTPGDYSEYDGEWKDNFRTGTGTMRYTDGGEYTGEWKDGMKDGIGTMKFANGYIYEGEWKDDYLYNGAKSYKGYVEEGEFDPDTGHLINGRKTQPDGDYYDGTFDPETGDFISGTRRRTVSTGEVYEGEWSNGQANGHGTWFYNDGTSRSGTWKDNHLVSWDDEAGN